MHTLIVGIGALGGVIAARLLGAGIPISLATRDPAAAAKLRASGLRVDGVGGAVVIPRLTSVAALDAYDRGARFDLVLLATKAHDAIALAPRLAEMRHRWSHDARVHHGRGGARHLRTDLR